MEWKEKWKVTDVMADTLRILICHGYLLRGTGSNMYVQSLARALCREGHHVLIMCQDSDPSLDFVSSYIREGPRSSGPQVVWERGTAYPGKCSVFQPDIGGVLPVYVMDTYPGFRVKEFTQLDDAELDWYVDRNRRSLTRLVEQFAPDAIQANHAVMLPHIVRPVAQRAEVPYYVTIHGSAIEYTVKKDPRYLPFGAEGLEGAAGIFVPSEHTARQVTEVFGAMVEGLSAKITFIPPGVDTELFTLAERDLSSSVDLLCDAVAGRTQGVTVGDFRGRNNTGTARLRDGFDIEEQIADTNAMHPDWLPEEDLDARLHALAAENRPFITFLGKLLETKGVQCIVPAMPLVLRDHPDARLVVIGFGELRGLLELMIDAIDQADIERLRRLCDFGNEHYTLAEDAFGPVLSFLDDLDASGEMQEYARLSSGFDIKGSVLFTGYLAPEEHRYLLPYSRAVLVPSLAQEAFGLVATEAMAAGVVPIASRHSGLETALEPMQEIWGREADVLLLGNRERFVKRIAEACSTVLDMQDAVLRARGAQMRGVVRMRFSWEAVARRMVDIFEQG
jgi:glycosyltransferase involved in cell wall biosynthesis